MLGSGLIAFGTPAALAASLAAIRSAPDRVFAALAIGLSAVDLLALVAWFSLTPWHFVSRPYLRN